jgi:hypothetical protein
MLGVWFKSVVKYVNQLLVSSGITTTKQLHPQLLEGWNRFPTEQNLILISFTLRMSRK